jgi:hypothetical protein
MHAYTDVTITNAARQLDIAAIWGKTLELLAERGETAALALFSPISSETMAELVAARQEARRAKVAAMVALFEEAEREAAPLAA